MKLDRFCFIMSVLGSPYLYSSLTHSPSNPRLAPSPPKTLILNPKALKHTHKLQLHGLKSLCESYECILPKDILPTNCFAARVIGNRYENPNRIECYLVSNNDTYLDPLPSSIFFTLRKMAAKRGHHLRELAMKIFDPELTLPERLRDKTSTEQKAFDRM